MKKETKKRVGEIFYVCESEFIKSNIVNPHSSRKHLGFYDSIPKKFRKKEEDHSLYVHKNLNTNEFEIVKRYNREIPKLSIDDIDQSISQEFLKNPIQTFLGTDKFKQFMLNTEEVIYKTKDLWDSVKKAKEIFKNYYKDIPLNIQYTPCLHHNSSIAPYCIIKLENQNL